MARTVTPKVAALIERGMQSMRTGEFLEAARAFERALQQMPELAEVHAMRGDALLRANKPDMALASAERALRLRADWAEALMLRGNIEAELGRFAEAEASFRGALRALGPAAPVQANLGNVLLEQGKFEDALAAFEAALGARDDAGVHAGKAKALFGLGRVDDAERAWRAVLERDPGSLEAMEQLLQLYMGMRRIDELEEICARGAAAAPEGAMFRIGQGFAAWWRGRADEAIGLYREAARIAQATDPSLYREACLNEAMCLFKLGRWGEGWERYRFRLDRAALHERYPLLASDPAALAAPARMPLRIRIHAEQGLGDELFFLRFAPSLRAAGHRLSYRGHVKLIALLAARADLFDGVGREDEADPLPCDVELQSSDLALASGREVAPALPLPLAPEPARREAMAARLRAFGPPPYLGVSWGAGLTPEEQKAFSGIPIWVKRAPPAELGEALRGLRASVIVLQRKPDAQDAAAFISALGRPALDASDCNDDLQDAIALLSLLDEYVGVSNTNMHLMAGLAGKRARVLVQSPAEWRWGMTEEKSAWFPEFALYRQASDRSWRKAIGRLRADLETLYKL
jgi:tetratricopeptide (TPR) repeat protein